MTLGEEIWWLNFRWFWHVMASIENKLGYPINFEHRMFR